MVCEAFSTSDVTVVLKTPSKEHADNPRAGRSRVAGFNEFSGVHCGCSAECQQRNCLSIADNLTNFLLQLYS